MSRYFCHNCNIRLDRVNDDFTCPTCSGGFVEELDESQESQQQDFLPGLGQAPFNPLDFLQLIGFNPLGQQSQQHQHPRQPRSQSHPSSPTGGATGGGGLSGGTPSTLAGAATASAAAAANSQSTQNARSRSRSRGGGGPGIWTHHTPHFSFVIDGRQVHGLGGGGGGGAGGPGGGGTGGEPGVENMFMSFLSDLITGLGGGIPITGNINLGDYAWGREGLDAIVTQLMNNMEGTGPPPMTEEKLALLIRIQITSEQVDAKLQCSVCWEDFKLSENVIRLECEHIFHPDCILPWLKLHATCPVCRKELNGTNSEEMKQEESRMTDSMNNPQPAAAVAAASTTPASSSSSTNRPFYDEDMEFD